MNVKLLTPTAKVPTRGTPGASCFDLHADLPLGPVTIKAKGHGRINTGISVEVPIGLEVQVRPRSGLAAKNGVFSHFGTVDSDYRGEVGVILFNLGDSDFVVNHGDRIAQIAVCGVGVMPINVVGSLSDTSRGSGGFGSTGV